MRIRKEILIIILFILFINFGLIISINNDIVSVSYIVAIMLLANVIRKRYEIEVR